MAGKIKYSLEDAKTLAVNKGGKCLSKEYSPFKKLLWECGDCSNTWEALFYSVKRGTWCPHCVKPYEGRSPQKRTCLFCRSEFISFRKDTNYCSRLCFRRSNSTTYKQNQMRHYNKVKYTDIYRHQSMVKKSKYLGFTSDISLEQYMGLLSTGCLYCSAPLNQVLGIALDRLNNDLGYTVSNVVPCCGKCNQIRNVHLTHEEMKVAMKAVLEYRKSLETP